MSAPWVLAVMANADPAEPRPHVYCQRCGERVVTELPIRVDTWVAMTNAFIRVHRECEP